MSVLVLAVAWLYHTLEPRPYKGVELREYSVVDDRHVAFVATFQKTACTFRRLQVVGSSADQTEFLDWRDLDGLTGTEDRTHGYQTMRLEFDLKRDGYDWVEVRTRHDCNGRAVDKVFLRFDAVP